jgi:hypothetical protein
LETCVLPTELRAFFETVFHFQNEENESSASLREKPEKRAKGPKSEVLKHKQPVKLRKIEKNSKKGDFYSFSKIRLLLLFFFVNLLLFCRKTENVF